MSAPDQQFQDLALRAHRGLLGSDQVLHVPGLTEFGRGGSYCVYHLPHAPSLVLKVPYMDWSLGWDPERINLAYEELRRWLPRSSLPQHALPAVVRMDDYSRAAASYVVYQQLDRAMSSTGTVSINSPYIEFSLRTERIPAYERMNAGLLGQGPTEYAGYGGFNTAFAEIALVLAGHPALRDPLREFVRSSCSFILSTNQLLDLVGETNAYAVMDAPLGTWRVGLGTAIKFQDYRRLLQLLEALPTDADAVRRLPIRDRSDLMNGVAVLRLLVALSLLIGDEDPFRVRLPPERLQALRYLRH